MSLRRSSSLVRLQICWCTLPSLLFKIFIMLLLGMSKMINFLDQRLAQSKLNYFVPYKQKFERRRILVGGDFEKFLKSTLSTVHCLQNFKQNRS